MIRDLSRVLKSILEYLRRSPENSPIFPELAEAQISFERPSENFNPGQTTVNLFLYDIREHLELRNNEPSIEIRGGQAIIHNPPKRIACSYLVTAWPVGGEELPLQEHRLLSQVLQIFSAYPTIPERFLEGTLLVDQEPPLPMVTAQVDGVQGAAEFWTALGNQLRPSITVTATFALEELFFEELFAPKELTPIVITQNLQLGQRISPSLKQIVPATEQRWFRIGGQVTDAVNQPVVGAKVHLVERNLSVATDAQGNYRIGAIPSGTYTLRVELGGNVSQEVNIEIPARTIESNYNVKLEQ